MEWYVAIGAGALALLLKKRGAGGRTRLLWGLSVYGAMAGQLICLEKSGLLSLQTALPLHLCSASGILCLPMLLSGAPGLIRFFRRLSLPGALLALLFPAPLQTRYPAISDFCFFALHGLLLFSPLLAKPASGGGRGALSLCAALIALALLADLLIPANYLFLRALPGQAPGAPLGRAMALWLLSPLICLIELPANKRGGFHHETKNRHPDQRRGLPGAQRGHSGRGPGGL